MHCCSTTVWIPNWLRDLISDQIDYRCYDNQISEVALINNSINNLSIEWPVYFFSFLILLLQRGKSGQHQKEIWSRLNSNYPLVEWLLNYWSTWKNYFFQLKFGILQASFRGKQGLPFLESIKKFMRYITVQNSKQWEVEGGTDQVSLPLTLVCQLSLCSHFGLQMFDIFGKDSPWVSPSDFAHAGRYPSCPLWQVCVRFLLWCPMNTMDSFQICWGTGFVVFFSLKKAFSFSSIDISLEYTKQTKEHEEN